MMREREPIDKATREEVYHKFGGKCSYCGYDIGTKGFHVDHVIPVAAGGPDDQLNLFPSCKHCNSLKNSFTLEQFRMMIEEYHLKSGAIVASRFNTIWIIGPTKVVFWFEKCGYTFPEELVKGMMRG